MLEYNTERDGTFRVRFTAGGDEVIVTGDVAGGKVGSNLHDDGGSVRTKVSGDAVLTSNATLIEQLLDYGWYSRAAGLGASEVERTREDRKAAESKRRIKFLEALIEAPISDWVDDRWCSVCFAKADQTLREPIDGQTAAWLCSHCGAPTIPCAAKECPNFAARPYGSLPALEYCAEHTHEIPSFAALDVKLPEITDYARVLKYAQPNLARRKTPLNILATPIKLADKALKNADLPESASQLFGAVRRELGQAAGAHLASVVSREDKSFDIEVLREGRGAPVLLANGFLSQSKRGWDNWRRLIDERYPNRPVFRVCWGAQELDSLKPFIQAAQARGEELKGADAVKDALLKTGLVAGIPMVGETAAKWQVAKQRATNTGLVLANLIERTETPRYVLMGFSLGARVMVAAARALADAGAVGSDARISEMHLFGGAVRQSTELYPIVDAVHKAIWNYYSNNDTVLGIVYKTAEFGAEAIGFDGIKLNSPKVHDIDVSAQVAQHNLYLPNVTLRRICN